jgi:lipopolysaccharide/colanic/teichoic acid biosynthesis glycosyltransferase
MSPYRGKRALDLLVAATAGVLLAPVVAAVTIAVWLEDGAAPLFSQPRVGRGREPFTILKFRTLREGNVTRVGQWLRHTGIDELPQFVNVCRGQMSAVGPPASPESFPRSAADCSVRGRECPRQAPGASVDSRRRCGRPTLTASRRRMSVRS